MALQHLRSSTANKRPTPAAMSDGQLAMNTNLASPGLFFKDSNGDSVKIGPVHVGTTAPNATPGAGGQAGNSVGEAWLDTTAANPILKVWNGSAFVAVQPVGTGTVVSTTDTGTVTSTMILDGTIVNADINASAAIALSKLATGALPTAITITTANIVDETIVNADINLSAAIADTKLATIATSGKVSNSATTATDANTLSAIVARDASGNFSAGTITASLTGNASTVTTNANLTGDVTSVGNATSIASGVIVNADVNASAAIAGTKISPDFGSQTVTTTGVVSAALGAAATPSLTFTGDLNTGVFSPGADQVAISTNETERLRITSAGLVGIGTSAPSYTFDVAGQARVSTRLRIDGPSSGDKLKLSGITTGPIFADIANTGNTTIIGNEQSTGGALCSGGLAYATVINAQSARSLQLATSNTARLTISSTGLVGIGTTSPAVPLDVVGQIRAINSTVDLRLLPIPASNVGIVGLISNHALVLTTNNTERARIDTSGRLLVGTSSANANGGVLQLNSGITFPATQVAVTDVNTLDDYEEGTWTPTLTTTGTGFSSITYISNSGGYTKIGNTVIAWFFMYTDAVTIGSASGNVLLSGLPFSVDSSVSSRSSGALQNVANWTAGNMPESVGNIGGGTSLSIWKRTTAGGAQARLVPSDVGTGAANNSMHGVFVYRI